MVEPCLEMSDPISGWESFLEFSSEPQKNELEDTMWELIPPGSASVEDLLAQPQAATSPRPLAPQSAKCKSRPGSNENLKVTGRPLKKRRKTAKQRRPKKPRTGYNYFHLFVREKVMKSLVESGHKADREALNAEVNRRIAQSWKTLKTEEKLIHVQKAEEDKLRYEVEMRKYRASQSTSAESGGTKNGDHHSRCLPGTLDGLRSLAEQLGVKKPGIGWPLCCPPNGTKIDIQRAVLKHVGKSDPIEKLVSNRLCVERAISSSTIESTSTLSSDDSSTNTTKLLSKQVAPSKDIRLPEKLPEDSKDQLMSMRNISSRSWLLDLAKHHNLLSNDTKPFLKDAMNVIEKEVSLTMTRMSKQVLQLVAQYPDHKKNRCQRMDAATNSVELVSALKKEAGACSNETRLEDVDIQRHCLNIVRELSTKELNFNVSRELVRMVEEVTRRDISRPQSLVKLVSGEVKGFFLLNKPLCDLLIQEAKRCAIFSGLKLGQISLEFLGLKKAVTRLAIECILPSVGLDPHEDYEVDGSVIYDGDKPLFDDYKFTYDPADQWSFSGSERSLPTHKVILYRGSETLGSLGTLSLCSCTHSVIFFYNSLVG